MDKQADRKYRVRPAIAWGGSVLLAALLLSWCIARRPVAVNPDYVYSFDCTFEDGSVTIQPQGPYNPYKFKEWKVTARYEPSDKTVYVTCWLKPSFTFNSFGAIGIPLAGYGEVERIVLTDGWMGGAGKTAWESAG